MSIISLDHFRNVNEIFIESHNCHVVSVNTEFGEYGFKDIVGKSVIKIRTTLLPWGILVRILK